MGRRSEGGCLGSMRYCRASLRPKSAHCLMFLLPQHKEDFAERMCQDRLPLRRLPLDCGGGDDSVGGADGGCGRGRGRARLG